MRRRRIQNILLKEWQVIFSSPSNALYVTWLPVLIVFQGMLYIWLGERFGGEALLTTSVFQTALGRLREALPELNGLSQPDQSLVLLLSQFQFFLLLIPAMVAISFATFSIVEEKLSGSLEPLLATPVRTWELLLGKALSGAVPALVVTWLCGLLFIAGASWLGWGHLIYLVLNPTWFMSLFLLTPAVTLLSFLLGVIGSSRARDAKSAQNLAVLIVLPVFALIGVQVSGVVWFTPVLTLGLAAGLAAADILVLKLAVRLFQREAILTRWRY